MSQLQTELQALQIEREAMTPAGEGQGGSKAVRIAQLHARLRQLVLEMSLRQALGKAQNPEKTAPRDSPGVAPSQQAAAAPERQPLPAPGQKVPGPPYARVPAIEIGLPGKSNGAGQPADLGPAASEPPGAGLPGKTEDLPALGIGRPADPQALAELLFQTGDFDGALKAYRSLDAGGQRPEERLAVQYMTACCLRQLGKMDEAATLYREVANSKDDDMLASCAQWQLSALRWHHELNDQLEQLRQRRQALEVKP